MRRFISIFVLIYLAAFNCFGQSKKEQLKINWPDEYNWKVGSDQKNDSEHLIELVPKKETVDNWTLMGTMLSLKGVKVPSIDFASDYMFKQAQKSSKDAKLTVLEKDEQIKNQWILFKIECSEFNDGQKPESDLYYVIQGETSLYINFVAIKEQTIPLDFVNKWSKIFKSSALVDQ